MDYKVFSKSSRKSQNSYEWIHSRVSVHLVSSAFSSFSSLPLLLPLARVTNNSASNFIEHIWSPFISAAGEGELALATDALINHDPARQLALEAERWRDGEIQMMRVGYIRYSDMDISPLELRVICRHDQMWSEDGQGRKSKRRRGRWKKKSIPSLVPY